MECNIMVQKYLVMVAILGAIAAIGIQDIVAQGTITAYHGLSSI